VPSRWTVEKDLIRLTARTRSVDNRDRVFYRSVHGCTRYPLWSGGHFMAVNDSAAVRTLSDIELMGHLFRRAGFGASRDELEVALAKMDRYGLSG
jgi:hypothetical protein